MGLEHLGAILTAAFLGLTCPTNGADSTGGRIKGIGFQEGRTTLSFDSLPGNAYQVQRLGRLGERWWTDVGAPLLATEAATAAELPASPGPAFFRVLEFAAPALWYDWNYYPQYPHLAVWGLGDAQEDYAHVDRPYEWFIDQADTGRASGNNCGPASVTMACHWHAPAFSRTVADAREWSASWRGEGWWYTSDITSYLNLNQIPNSTVACTDIGVLKDAISRGYLALLCINTAYLSWNHNEEQRVGRFYGYASGHFLIIKGWRTVSGVTYLESYDPNTWHAAYPDRSPKGRNRHYSADDLGAAIRNWWQYAVLIPPAGGSGGAAPNFARVVDPSRIPHQWGR